MKTCSYCQGENDAVDAVECSECGTDFVLIDPQVEDPTLSLVIVGANKDVEAVREILVGGAS